jgi:hypothetical protein
VYHDRSQDFVAQPAYQTLSFPDEETEEVKFEVIQNASAVSLPSCRASTPFLGFDSPGTSQSLPSDQGVFVPCTRISVHDACTNRTKAGRDHILPNDAKTTLEDTIVRSKERMRCEEYYLALLA